MTILPESTTTEELLAEIDRLNAHPDVYGILLQHPVPAQIDERRCFDRIAIEKDVDGVTSHGLALFLLQGADDEFGIACLGGECFGQAGAGFLRFSCAESNERLQQALEFIPKAIARTDRLAAWLDKNTQYRLTTPYTVE